MTKTAETKDAFSDFADEALYICMKRHSGQWWWPEPIQPPISTNLRLLKEFVSVHNRWGSRKRPKIEHAIFKINTKDMVRLRDE